jgi:tetratricopeptide (TPR) repeat protein
MIRSAHRRLVAAVALMLGLNACASNPPPPPVVTTPKYPAYPMPDIPAALRVPADVQEHHRVAWLRLQAGDLRGANRDFSALLKRAPDFYPGETGLGYVLLADREFKSAAARFTAALARNDRYMSAWLGQIDAQLGLENDTAAIAAMERVLTLDPRQDAVRSRLELVRFRQVQTLIDAGRRARLAGRLDQARQTLEDALKLSPTSAAILRELTLVATKSGNLDGAEGYARKAVQLEPNDAEGHAALAAVLESQNKYREAAAEFSRATAIEARPEWRTKATALREKADLAALPPEFGDIASATTITRAHAVVYIGLRLGKLIDAAPQQPAVVATDVRNHWAAPWINPVTRAGVMDVFANHTFQPGATVRRNDLAQIAARLLTLAAVARPEELARWRAARPKFADLPATNVFYRSAALTVAAGAMAADREGRFEPTAAATGADLTAVVARVQQIAPR